MKKYILFFIGAIALLSISAYSTANQRKTDLNSYSNKVLDLEHQFSLAECELMNERNLRIALGEDYDNLMAIKVNSRIEYVHVYPPPVASKPPPPVVNPPKPAARYFTGSRIKTADAYIKRFAKTAKAEQAKFNIPASITLGQGLLESGAGTSYLATKGNNHFGHKYFSRKHVPAPVRYLTDGYVARHDDCCTNRKCSKPDKFIKFKSAWASVRAHSLLLQKGRYKNCYASTDYKKWAHALRAAGYATDKRYAYKLIRIIEQFELYKYDA